MANLAPYLDPSPKDAPEPQAPALRRTLSHNDVANLEYEHVPPETALQWLKEARKEHAAGHTERRVAYLDADEVEDLCVNPALVQRVTRRPPGAVLSATREANRGAAAFDLHADIMGIDRAKMSDMRAALELLRPGRVVLARDATARLGDEAGIDPRRPLTRPSLFQFAGGAGGEAEGPPPQAASSPTFAQGGLAARRVATQGGKDSEDGVDPDGGGAGLLGGASGGGGGGAGGGGFDEEIGFDDGPKRRRSTSAVSRLCHRITKCARRRPGRGGQEGRGIGGAVTDALATAKRRRVVLKQALTAVESSKLKPARFAWTRDGLVQYAFFLTLGLAGALLAVLHDRLVEASVAVRHLFTTISPNYWWQYAAALLSASFFAALSAACTFYISRASAGSGIPEMKAILTGVVLPRVLSWRTMLAKLLGLNFALTAGFSVGKEGPFGHIVACLAHLIVRSPRVLPSFYRVIGSNPPAYHDILLTAMAAGFAGNFMAPVGGTLFSLEVCTGFYMVDNLWKGIFVTVHVVLFSRLMRSLAVGDHEPMFKAPPLRFSAADGSARYFFHLFLIVLMSAGLGALGAAFVRCTKAMVRYRLQNLKQQHFQLVICTAIFITLITYPIPFWRSGDKSFVNQFFSTLDPSVWGHATYWQPVKLFSWCVRKFFITLLSIVQPIPAGVYTPCFALGAGLGRVMGEIVRFGFPGVDLNPAVYAMVGAAAMVSGVTRTLSAAVIVFELTGQLELLLPVLLGVVFSVIVGRLFTKSVFDELLQLRKLPYMALSPRGVQGRSTGRLDDQFFAVDLMRTPVTHVLTTASLSDVLGVLMSTSYLEFPLCSPSSKGGLPMLLGTVYRANLVKAYTRLQRELAVDPRPINTTEGGVWTFYLRVITAHPLGGRKAGLQASNLSKRTQRDGLPMSPNTHHSHRSHSTSTSCSSTTRAGRAAAVTAAAEAEAVDDAAGVGKNERDGALALDLSPQSGVPIISFDNGGGVDEDVERSSREGEAKGGAVVAPSLAVQDSAATFPSSSSTSSHSRDAPTSLSPPIGVTSGGTSLPPLGGGGGSVGGPHTLATQSTASAASPSAAHPTASALQGGDGEPDVRDGVTPGSQTMKRPSSYGGHATRAAEVVAATSQGSGGGDGSTAGAGDGSGEGAGGGGAAAQPSTELGLDELFGSEPSATPTTTHPAALTPPPPPSQTPLDSSAVCSPPALSTTPSRLSPPFTPPTITTTSPAVTGSGRAVGFLTADSEGGSGGGGGGGSGLGGGLTIPRPHSAIVLPRGSSTDEDGAQLRVPAARGAARLATSLTPGADVRRGRSEAGIRHGKSFGGMRGSGFGYDGSAVGGADAEDPASAMSQRMAQLIRGRRHRFRRRVSSGEKGQGGKGVLRSASDGAASDVAALRAVMSDPPSVVRGGGLIVVPTEERLAALDAARVREGRAPVAGGAAAGAGGEGGDGGATAGGQRSRTVSVSTRSGGSEMWGGLSSVGGGKRGAMMREYLAAGTPAALSVPFSPSFHTVSPFTPISMVRLERFA